MAKIFSVKQFNGVIHSRKATRGGEVRVRRSLLSLKNGNTMTSDDIADLDKIINKSITKFANNGKHVRVSIIVSSPIGWRIIRNISSDHSSSFEVDALRSVLLTAYVRKSK